MENREFLKHHSTISDSPTKTQGFAQIQIEGLISAWFDVAAMASGSILHPKDTSPRRFGTGGKYAGGRWRYFLSKL